MTQPERPRNLLLVDDEPNILSTLKRLLRPDGYTILACDSPELALETLSQHPVDVILSDQRMPSMTGVEFLRRVKEKYPDTVRIVLSGYTELQSVTDAINEGAIYKFLTKPWDDGQLRANLREAFHRKEMDDENRRLTLEVQAANVELNRVNQELQQLLAEKARQAEQLETILETLQEVLQVIPWPIVGMDQEGLIALSNTAADACFGRGMPLLGESARDLLPAVLGAPLPEGGGVGGEVCLDGHLYRMVCGTLGRRSRASGRLLALLPCEERTCT